VSSLFESVGTSLMWTVFAVVVVGALAHDH
jgi:hypothetical protein